MSNIVEPQIVETNPSVFSDFIKKNLENTSSTPVLCKDGTTKNELSSPNARFADACINNGGRADLTAQQKAQLQLAQQKALMEQMTTYSGLTDKVFGKQSNFVSGGGNRFLILPTYMILGAVVGRYVAKNMKKSATLGMVVGGLAPLLVLKLTMEYDKKNMPKQEPLQKVGMNPDGSIMTEKQIANTQISSDISKFIPQSNPKLGNQMPIDYSNTLFGTKNCPNGTKKISMNCIKAPCPEMEVCA